MLLSLLSPAATAVEGLAPPLQTRRVQPSSRCYLPPPCRASALLRECGRCGSTAGPGGRPPPEPQAGLTAQSRTLRPALLRRGRPSGVAPPSIAALPRAPSVASPTDVGPPPHRPAMVSRVSRPSVMGSSENFTMCFVHASNGLHWILNYAMVSRVSWASVISWIVTCYELVVGRTLISYFTSHNILEVLGSCISELVSFHMSILCLHTQINYFSGQLPLSICLPNEIRLKPNNSNETSSDNWYWFLWSWCVIFLASFSTRWHL
jgi:hypothetical protein